MTEPTHKNKSSSKFSYFLTPNLVAIFFCICVFGAWLNLLIYKFNHFGYDDWDLGIYTNAMWALSHGSFTGSLWGTNFLTNHPEYISILIVPIYWLFPSAITLITLKLLSFVAAGFILYLIAKERIGWPLALMMMLLYFAFPANVFMLIFEFHFESLAIVFLFLIYYYARTHVHYGKFILCCVLASLCKENIPPLIFMFGFMTLFQKEIHSRKFAWTAMGTGIIVFILAIFVITPILRHGEGMTSTGNPYTGLYWSGHEKLSLIENLTQNLQQFRLRLFNPITTTYLKDLFFPLLFLPFLGFQTLVISLPVFLETLLSINPAMHGIHHHYAATLVPFLFLATLEFITWAQNRFAKWVAVTFILLLVASLSFNWKYHLLQFKDKVAIWQSSDTPARWAMIKQIPPDAGVISTFEFLSLLANRSDVYPLRNIWNYYNIFKYSSNFVPPQTPYALIDWDNQWLWDESVTNDRTATEKSLGRLKDFYFNNNWQVKAAAGEVTLLEKMPISSKEQRISLVEVQKKPFVLPVDSINKSVNIDNRIELLYSEVSQNSFANFKRPLTSFTFYWKVNSDIDERYTLKIGFLNKHKYSLTSVHNIGYAVYPTPIWKKDDYIKETYWLDSASLRDGQFSIQIAIANLTQNRWATLTYQSKIIQQIQIGSMTIQSKKEDLANEK